LTGTGVYLRTDFWVKINAGGSYGHTCHVARELARVTENFVAFMPHRYELLDEFGVRQEIMPSPSPENYEEAIARATDHYYAYLKTAFTALKPAYIYERLCLGNSVGVRLSQELQIPYIVEYNGSEISMQRSFGASNYKYERYYLQAEAAAFAQATLISVVSEPIKTSLIGRGVPADKIIVNPNAADPILYAPCPAPQRQQLRRELGWNDSHLVIGFTGTFGKWHGNEVLAEALPAICRAVPEARFLLIGDGVGKAQVDEAVRSHHLDARVKSVGMVPQKEGARLMGACDLFICPHNYHMVDSPFFGSPTKVFEYMAMGKAIVASDLEQIGEVLSPALRPEQLQEPGCRVTEQRSVLCQPGNSAEFIAAIVALARQPELRQRLGDNARQALQKQYTWAKHVARLWNFPRQSAEQGEQRKLGLNGAGKFIHTDRGHPDRGQPHLKEIATADAYKSETQKQWNNNPCGSQYVKNADKHTLDWYREVEDYRYQVYAPWMPHTMEFAMHKGQQVLEIGGGLGTDLAQFAAAGAIVTDLDLSAGHLELAQENFRLRGLSGTFLHHDAEGLPFADNTFDVVYSNGVIHHTPNTAQVVSEIRRVLKPGGKAIIMVYAENSLHYWYRLALNLGVRYELLSEWSMGEIMSRSVELTATGAKPLVKVYTKQRLLQMFGAFSARTVCKRQLMRSELPLPLRWLPLGLAQRVMGWNLIIKAAK
jgi:glycosyltransferase involved in cell wall biosynthesis/ubiquinone/menaquinone biosynthesis C-methylase UbiE